MRSTRTTLAGAAVLAVHRAQVAAEAMLNSGPQVVENHGQAMPKGAQLAARGPRRDRKARARAAALELTIIGRTQIDASRIHPRWLRKAVNIMLDARCDIGTTTIELLKCVGEEQGAEAAFRRAERLVVDYQAMGRTL